MNGGVTWSLVDDAILSDCEVIGALEGVIWELWESAVSCYYDAFKLCVTVCIERIYCPV